MKYKIRRRKIKTWHIVLVLMVLLFTLSISYSLWSSTLSIIGTVTGKISTSSNTIQFVPQTTGGTDYITNNFNATVATLQSQTVENNTLTINYLGVTTKGTPITSSVNINFKNDCAEAITNGTATYELSGTTAFFASQPTVTTSSSVESGQNGTITVNFNRLRFNNLNAEAICKVTVSYQVNGETIEYYVEFHFTK